MTANIVSHPNRYTRTILPQHFRARCSLGKLRGVKTNERRRRSIASSLSEFTDATSKREREREEELRDISVIAPSFTNLETKGWHPLPKSNCAARNGCSRLSTETREKSQLIPSKSWQRTGITLFRALTRKSLIVVA